MDRVLTLLMFVLILSMLIMFCFGSVIKIFNHPEEHLSDKQVELQDDVDKSRYCPNDDQITDDAYPSLDLDDYKNGAYPFNKPDYKTRLMDALSRSRYVDGSLKTKRQTNQDRQQMFDQFKQTPYYFNCAPNDNYSSRDSHKEENIIDTVTYLPRNFDNILYDEFYKSNNNSTLLSKLPQTDQEIQSNSVDSRPQNAQNYKMSELQNSISSIIKKEIEINKNIAFLSSLIKNKKDEKFKDQRCPKEPSEYDKFKREIPDTDPDILNNTDTADLKPGDVNDMIDNATGEYQKKRNVNASTEFGDFEISDVNTDSNIFVNGNKENLEVNDEKENVGNNEDSDDRKNREDTNSLVDSAADEPEESGAILNKKPRESEIFYRNLSKPKHKLRDNIGHSSIGKDNERFRIRRRDDERKTFDNITGDISNKSLSKFYETIGNGSSSGGMSNYNNSNTNINAYIDNNETKSVSQSIKNFPHDKTQEEKSKIVNSGSNAVLSKPSAVLLPLNDSSCIRNDSNATDKPAVTVTCSKFGKGKDKDGGCLLYSTTKKPNISDELKIAKQINDYVRNLLVHASKTPMRKELGLCKTYEKAYTSVKNNRDDVEDEIMKGMIGCMTKILSGSIKPAPCGEMPHELLQFLDWLLLNGVSASDEFKQYMSSGIAQRKSFLFSKSDNGTDQCDLSKNKTQRSGPTDTFNKSNTVGPSLYNNLKKTILTGLSPYLKYGGENVAINRPYSFPNSHVISNRDLKIPTYNQDRSNSYNRYFFRPILDTELYRMYPYFRPSKERWNKINKYADRDPYDDMYLPRSKPGYQHLLDVYPKLNHDQQTGVVEDEGLARLVNPLSRKQTADFEGLR